MEYKGIGHSRKMDYVANRSEIQQSSNLGMKHGL